MANPLVSAIVITHNRKKLAINAIKSVLNQTYQPIELIVINDASTDGTGEVLKSMSDEFKFQFIDIPDCETKGGNHARNIGTLAAKGSYVAFLDDDDEWMPEKTTKQVMLLDKHPECGTCYCGRIILRCLDKYQTISNTSKPQNNYQTAEDVTKLDEGDLSTTSLIKCICSTSTMMIRRSLLLEIGLFDEELRFWQDNELCMRLFQKARVCVVRENLVLYRSIKTDAGRLSNNVNDWERAVEQIYEKHAAEMKTLSPKDIQQRDENRYKDGARRCHACGDKKHQKQYLRNIYKLSHKPKDLIKLLLNTTSIKEYFRFNKHKITKRPLDIK